MNFKPRSFGFPLHLNSKIMVQTWDTLDSERNALKNCIRTVDISCVCPGQIETQGHLGCKQGGIMDCRLNENHHG